MKSFKDTAGRDWEVAFTHASIKRVRDRLGVNLLDILEGGELYQRLLVDAVLWGDIIYLLCYEQAEQRKVDETTFMLALGEDSLDVVVQSLLEELPRFFLDPRRRTVLRQMMEKTRQIETKALEVMKTNVENLDPSALLATMSSTSATNSPESSESTPAPSPSPKSP